MWKCTECNREMNDDVLNCMDCQSPKPKTFGIELVEETVVDESTKNDPKIKEAKKEKKRELLKKYGLLVDIDSISEEQYKELIKESKKLNKPKSIKKSKSISRILKFIGYTNFIFYFILGFYLGTVIETDSTSTYNWLIASACITIGLVSGFSFLGLGKIIKLVNEVKSEKKAS